jgi:eukaryotic-like serine/threonine-protein kinase
MAPDLVRGIVSAGDRFGPYEILSLLGRGGMGDVYRAKDTRLDRTVAIKILRNPYTDLGARFIREAKAIAALSHPHICTAFDVGRQADTDYLVMECLEGETLAARLQRGMVPLDDALKIAVEIGDALDQAHRAGIVHRDLKPSNVMLTKTGAILLDFGLATFCSMQNDAVDATATVMPSQNITSALSGTVPYMAPEQFEGRQADARSDLFGFGAIVYETVTGRRAFVGESQASVIAAILEHTPPPVSTFQPLVPPALDRIVKKCLAKDPEARWQTVRDLVDELKWIREGATSNDGEVGRRPPRRILRRATIAALAGLVILIASVLVVRRSGFADAPPSGIASVRFELAAPEGTAFGISPASPGLTANGETTSFALSPDGSQLAFIASASSGQAAIWLRPLSRLTAQRVPGTDGPTSLTWSPDSRSIAFVADGQLKRLDIAGGSAVPVCDVSNGSGVSGTPTTWGNGVILFAPRGGRIFRVSTAGGPPTLAVEPQTSRGEIWVGWPWFLPDGRRFFYLAKLRNGEGRLMLADPGKPTVTILPAMSNPQWVDPDYLVFAKENGTLIGHRVDVATGHTVGEPFAIADAVQYNRGTARAAFSASRNGTLAYQAHKDLAELVWFGRSGHEVGPVGSQGDYISMRISPEGRRAIFARWDAKAGNYVDWTLDLERRVETRLSLEHRLELGGVWMPNGKGLFFSTPDGGAPHVIYRDLTAGTERPMVPATQFISGAQDVSPDGRLLAFFQLSSHGTDIWTMPVDGMTAASMLIAKGYDARFSSNGRFVSFISRDSGTDEVYVANSSPMADRTRVSQGGADTPRWSVDGRELIYRSADGYIVSVAVGSGTSHSIELGPPLRLFPTKGKWSWRDFDLTQDGRFLAIVPRLMSNEQPLTVVMNWVPTAGR